MILSTTLALALITGHKRCPRLRQAAPLACPSSVQATPQTPVNATAPPNEVHSFAAWLNSQRAQRGLRPCGISTQLCADATENSRRGFGHSFMGTARRQNAGVGTLPTVCSMWVASPAHAAALFDPSITAIGLGQVGPVITFAAN